MSTLNSLTVVITAYNEEKKLEACLESVKWANEIIVIDSSSTDKTVEIAKKFTQHVFTKPNHLMLNVNKNFGFSKAKSNWILSIDADERVSEELAKEIKEIVANTLEQRNGFRIPRKNIIFGKWIENSIWWPDYQLRLFKNGRGRFAEEHVHEMLEVDGEVGKTENALVHLNYDTISQFIYKMDKIYTENEANIYDRSGKEFQWYDVIRKPVGDFLKTFFLQHGYKDGLHGLVLSLLQAFYSLIVIAKVWEKKGFPEYNSDNFVKDVIKELKKTAHEFNYWILTVLIEKAKHTGHKLYYKVVRRKVKLHLTDKHKV